MDSSEKLKLLVIGKSKNPRCFKHVKSLPVQYEANKKAWMTGEMFTSWLRKMDRDFQRQKRKVLFFVDNCTAHPDFSGLSAIKLIFLPPNTTSKLQPMDQGIIKNLKVHYRKNMLLRYVAAVDGKQEFSINLLDAIHMLSTAWKSVLPQTVSRCFSHAGFEHSVEPTDEDESTMEEDLEYIWDRFNNDEVAFDDFVGVDDDLAVSAEMTDKDIAATVLEKHTEILNESDHSADEDISDQPPPTAFEALSGLSAVRRYIEAHSESNSSIASACHDIEQCIFVCMQNKVYQSKLTSYFNPV